MDGDVIAVAVPKIVEPDVWEVVQQKLSVTVIPHKMKYEYALQGLVFCACGRPLTAGWRRKYYTCQGYPKACDKCSSIKASKLDLAVSVEALKALMNPQAVEFLANQQTTMSDRDEILLQLDSLTVQIARIPDSRSKLIDFYTEGTIDKETFKQKDAALKAKKAQLESERETLQTQLGQAKADELTALKVAEVLSENRDRLAEHNRRLLLLAATSEDGIVIGAYQGKLDLPFTALNSKILRAVVRKVVVSGDSFTVEANVPMPEKAEKATFGSPTATSRKRSRTK